MCRDWVDIVAEMGELPFLPERTGSFWSKQAQVDVVAVNWRSKEILLGECKWGQQDVGRDVVQALLDKTTKVVPGEFPWRVHYAFFARHGFTPAAQALAAAHATRLLTLAQVEADLGRWLGREAIE